MAATVRIRLNPEARRQARSLKKLFESISRRDTRAILSNRPALIIFPPEDDDLTAAITLVVDRLDEVLSA